MRRANLYDKIYHAAATNANSARALINQPQKFLAMQRLVVTYARKLRDTKSLLAIAHALPKTGSTSFNLPLNPDFIAYRAHDHISWLVEPTNGQYLDPLSGANMSTDPRYNRSRTPPRVA